MTYATRSLFLLAGCSLLVLSTPAPLQAQPAPSPSTPSRLRAALLYGSSPSASPAPFFRERAFPSYQQQDAPPPEDAWFAIDKLKHFTVSFLWTVGTQYVLEDKFMLSEKQALPFSVGSSVAAGATKEFYDLHYGPTQYFSRRDLIVDAAGILTAAALIWL